MQIHFAPAAAADAAGVQVVSVEVEDMAPIDALDPDLTLPWELTEPPIRSAKDAAAQATCAAAS